MEGIMPGYCGNCQKHYRENGFDHEAHCLGPHEVEQGSEEDFENQQELNNWSDQEAKEVWDRYFRYNGNNRHG